MGLETPPPASTKTARVTDQLCVGELLERLVSNFGNGDHCYVLAEEIVRNEIRDATERARYMSHAAVRELVLV